MARVYAPRRLPFVVNVTAQAIFTLAERRETAQAGVDTSVIAESGQRSPRRSLARDYVIGNPVRGRPAG
jgi:hypothetical protein